MSDSTSVHDIDVSTFAKQLANATNIFEMLQLTGLAQTALAQRTENVARAIYDAQCAIEKLPETAFTLKPLCLDPATIDTLCKTLQPHFVELHTRLEAMNEKLSATSSEVGNLARNLRGLDELLKVFRDNIHSRLDLMEEEIRQIRGRAYVAIAESVTASEATQEKQERQAIVVAEVAELAADLEEARPPQGRVRRASGATKGRGKH